MASSDDDCVKTCCSWLFCTIFVVYYISVCVSKITYEPDPVIETECTFVHGQTKIEYESKRYIAYYVVSVSIVDSNDSWVAIAIGDKYGTKVETLEEIESLYYEENENGFVPCWYESEKDYRVFLWLSDTKVSWLIYAALVFLCICLLGLVSICFLVLWTSDIDDLCCCGCCGNNNSYRTAQLVLPAHSVVARTARPASTMHSIIVPRTVQPAAPARETPDLPPSYSTVCLDP